MKQNSQKNPRIFKMSFASVCPHYIQKAEKKGRTKAEVESIIVFDNELNCSAPVSVLCIYALIPLIQSV